MNEKLPFEKQSLCSAKLNCRAGNQDQQKECKYFTEPDCNWMKGNCFFFSSTTARCYSQKARSEALNKLIAAVKEQL
jgi:hypothetical protein